MEIKNRKTIRLKKYNYSQPGYYFVTICVQNHNCYFGDVINGEMVLNRYGDIAEKFWEEIPKHYKDVSLDLFVTMPNHIHGIVIIAPVGAAIGQPARKGGQCPPLQPKYNRRNL